MSLAVALDKLIIIIYPKSSLPTTEGIFRHANKNEISQSRHIKQKTSSHQ